MSRKQTKLKRRSCAMCKPHKMGWATRWTAKEKALRDERDWEEEINPTVDEEYNFWAYGMLEQFWEDG